MVPGVPDLKATSKRSDARGPDAERPEHAVFVTGIGRLVRLARAKRGMTRRQLAQESGASERYLAQIEGGRSTFRSSSCCRAPTAVLRR